MFGFLKKKVKEFTNKLIAKGEEKVEEAEKEPIQEEKLAPAEEKVEQVVEQIPEPVEEPKEETITEPEEKLETIPELIKEEPEQVIEEPIVIEEPVVTVPEPKVEEPKPEVIEEVKQPERKKTLSLRKAITKAITGGVFLSKEELDSFLWDFELELLEADVAHDVAVDLCNGIRDKLTEHKFTKKEDVSQVIELAVKETVREILDTGKEFNFLEEVKKQKPCVIMFIGPNGAGKTTTIAKIVTLLKKNGLTSILAASDTFRAASIEQLEYHAEKLGVQMIKHNYGADPAAIAFDAIKSAKAKGIDCVLIDTAGRQETNKNLIEELKKIERVCKPNIKLYVDEGLAGNVLVERVKQFKEAIGIDGVVLSKMDVDVKGGGAISIAHATSTPVIFFGVGQGYDDLEEFSADKILERVFG